MALSETVERNLKDAEQSLRATLSYAARQERPMVVSVLADLISRIESVVCTDKLLDKFESRKPGSSGDWSNFRE